MTNLFDSVAEAKIALARGALAARPGVPDLMYALADALAEAGRLDEYADAFRRAFLAMPRIYPWPATDAPATIARKAKALIERGVIYSPIIAGQAIAAAAMGDGETLTHLFDYDRFFRCVTAVKPPDAKGDYFSELAAEIKQDLTYYDRPNARAIRQGWRNNAVIGAQSPACRSMVQEIRRQIDHYMAILPSDASHPFVASRPAEYVLTGWAVVSNRDSFHETHIHSGAWMSGVYYVVRPAVSQSAAAKRAWLRVGPPALRAQAGALGWQDRMIAPEPGTLVMMPAYFFHETTPMAADEERICVAFDVCPPELVDDDKERRERHPVSAPQ